MFRKNKTLWTEESESDAINYYSSLLNTLTITELGETGKEFIKTSGGAGQETEILEILSLHVSSGCCKTLEENLSQAQSAAPGAPIPDKYGLNWQVGPEKINVSVKFKKADIEELDKRIGASDFKV